MMNSNSNILIRGKGLSLEESINRVSAILIVIITISPPLRVGMIYYFLIILCSSLWLMTSFMLHPIFFMVVSKPVSIIIFTFISMSGLLLIFGNIKYWKLEVGLFLYYFIVILFCYYRKYNEKFLFTLFWIVLIIVPIWSVITSHALSTNLYIARGIGEGSAANELNKQGIAGYGFVYMSTIIGIVCFIVYIKAILESKTKRAIILINVICSTILVVLSGFTIGVLSMVIFIYFYFLFSKNKKGKLKIGLFVLTIVFGLIIMLNIYTILDFLLIKSLGTSHYYKIYDFYQFLRTGILGPTFAARIDAYMLSIETFSKNLFLGLFGNFNVSLDCNVYGGHSTLLDGYSLFGIILGTLNLYVLLIIPIQIFRNKRYKTTSLPLGALASIFVVLLFNTITDFYAVATTIVLYGCVELICRESLSNG